jgi:hypothetical protein
MDDVNCSKVLFLHGSLKAIVTRDPYPISTPGAPQTESKAKPTNEHLGATEKKGETLSQLDATNQ